MPISALFFPWRSRQRWRLFGHFVFVASLLFLCSAQPASSQPPNRWALIVGVERYQDKGRIPGLRFAASDARAIKQTLIEVAGFPESHVSLFVSDADQGTSDEAFPERNAILNELTAMAKRIKPGDLVFVYFSGHGVLISNQSYLLPYDASNADPTTLAETSISVELVRKRLSKIPAKLSLTCFRYVPHRSGEPGGNEP